MLTGPAMDVWVRNYPSRKRGFLKSPKIMASKARLRRRKLAKIDGHWNAHRHAWRPASQNVPPDAW